MLLVPTGDDRPRWQCHGPCDGGAVGRPWGQTLVDVTYTHKNLKLHLCHGIVHGLRWIWQSVVSRHTELIQLCIFFPVLWSLTSTRTVTAMYYLTIYSAIIKIVVLKTAWELHVSRKGAGFSHKLIPPAGSCPSPGSHFHFSKHFPPFGTSWRSAAASAETRDGRGEENHFRPPAVLSMLAWLAGLPPHS